MFNFKCWIKKTFLPSAISEHVWQFLNTVFAGTIAAYMSPHLWHWNKRAPEDLLDPEFIFFFKKIDIVIVNWHLMIYIILKSSKFTLPWLRCLAGWEDWIFDFVWLETMYATANYLSLNKKYQQNRFRSTTISFYINFIQ